MKWLIIILLGVILMMSEVQSEILDERTEQTCNENSCIWSQYGSKSFDYEDGQWKPFSEKIQDVSYNDGKIIYNFTNDKFISLKFFVVYDGYVYFIPDLPESWREKLKDNVGFKGERFNSKFTMNVTIPETPLGINKVGFQFDTNIQNIKKVKFNHTPEGVYIDEDYPVYETYRFEAGKYAFSYTDLFDSGYDVNFRNDLNALVINLNGIGRFEFDPILSFNSSTDDGFLTFSSAPYICTGATNITTTATTGISASLNAETMIILPFDTSSIPDTATITHTDLETYLHSFTGRYTLPVDLWEVNYGSGKTNISYLDCADANLVSTNEGTVDWAEATGWHNKNILPASVNVTGFTNFRLLRTWTVQTGGADATIRTSEYAGDYAPRLIITYVEDPDYETGKPYLNWTLPTPANAETIYIDNTYLNLTVNDSSSTSTFMDWNNNLLLYLSMESYNSSGVFDNSSNDFFSTFENGLSDSDILGSNFGNATHFDGINDYLDIGNGFNLLDGAEEFTISFWILKEQAGNFPTHDGIISLGNNAERTPWIWGRSGTQTLRMQIEIDDVASDCNADTGTITQNVWTHIVGLWNGTDCVLYVNGVAGTWDSVSGTTIDNNNGENYIGEITPYDNWKGGIDEIHIHKRAFTESEIMMAYNSTKYKMGVNYTNLILGTYPYDTFAIDNNGNQVKEERTVIYGVLLKEVIPKKEVVVYPFILLITIMFIASGRRNEEK